MAKFKDIKNNAKDYGQKDVKSTAKDCYSNSVADNVKTQKKTTSSYESERRDGPGGN